MANMPLDSSTCTYCGQTGLSDWVKRRECFALAAAQSKSAYDATFNEFAATWLNDNLTPAQILATPGVAELLLEDNHNEIQEAFDAQDEDADDEEDEPEPDEEYEERRRIVQEVSRRTGGLTGSEVRDIMDDR